MQSIGKILGKREGARDQRGPNSARSDAIEQLMDFMGEPKPNPARQAGKSTYHKRFKYWLGRTKKLTPAEILDMMKQAREGKNPPALFNWLLKNYAKRNTN